jgi:hypothetical protein
MTFFLGPAEQAAVEEKIADLALALAGRGGQKTASLRGVSPELQLVGHEAVEQPGTPGLRQIVLATAA